MAVFTSVTLEQISAWTRQHFGFSATALTPISEGIENTNYLITVGERRYIFTILEVWDFSMARYYANFMRHIAARQTPVPAPLKPHTEDGYRWNNKPCLLCPFIDGQWQKSPTADACGQMGMITAKLHLAVADFTFTMDNPRNHQWRRLTAEKIKTRVAANTWKTLQNALQQDARLYTLPLPAGACHCDLFRNNVLWKNNDIAGIIDFYFGGDDLLIFDLTVCACDWCFDPRRQQFDARRFNALLIGYESIRPLCDLEKECFYLALQSAALRFWISRLYDWYFPRDANLLTPHDPNQFEIIYQQAKNHPPPLPIADKVA